MFDARASRLGDHAVGMMAVNQILEIRRRRNTSAAKAAVVRNIAEGSGTTVTPIGPLALEPNIGVARVPPCVKKLISEKVAVMVPDHMFGKSSELLSAVN